MDYMYEIPSDDDMKELTITKEIVDSHLLLDDSGEKGEKVVPLEDKKSDKESA